MVFFVLLKIMTATVMTALVKYPFGLKQLLTFDKKTTPYKLLNHPYMDPSVFASISINTAFCNIFLHNP